MTAGKSMAAQHTEGHNGAVLWFIVAIILFVSYFLSCDTFICKNPEPLNVSVKCFITASNPKTQSRNVSLVLPDLMIYSQRPASSIP